MHLAVFAKGNEEPLWVRARSVSDDALPKVSACGKRQNPVQLVASLFAWRRERVEKNYLGSCEER